MENFKKDKYGKQCVTAGHYNLHEVILLIDRNIFQGDRATIDVMSLDPLADKFLSFGWDIKSVNGHDFQELHKGLSACESDKPKAIIANTIKGKESLLWRVIIIGMPVVRNLLKHSLIKQ